MLYELNRDTKYLVKTSDQLNKTQNRYDIINMFEKNKHKAIT